MLVVNNLILNTLNDDSSYINNLIMKIFANKNIIKGATQVNGHSLKLHFCMFERSQVKHNSLDYHNFFGNIFH
jgi:hypothetical protein